MSACGNFSIIGSSTGSIHMYNMQSGIQRKTFNIGPYPIPVASSSTSGAKLPEGRAITGIASDPLNTILVASTFDGTINVGSCSFSGLESY